MTTPDLPPVCCGNCKHATHDRTFNDFHCNAPVPWWVGEATTVNLVDSVMLLPTDGTDCPAFQGTEEGTEAK